MYFLSRMQKDEGNLGSFSFPLSRLAELDEYLTNLHDFNEVTGYHSRALCASKLPGFLSIFNMDSQLAARLAAYLRGGLSAIGVISCTDTGGLPRLLLPVKTEEPEIRGLFALDETADRVLLFSPRT